MAPTIPHLQEAAAKAGDGVAVVAATGTCNASVIPLLDKGLRLDVSGGRDLSSASSSRGERRAGPPSIIAAGVEDGPLVLALDGLDAMTGDEAAVDDALALSVSLAGVVLLSVRMHNIARAQAAGVTRVMGAIERSLKLRVAGIAPVIPPRRLLVIAVTEFDDEEASPDEATSSVESLLANAYDAIEVPDQLVATTVSDVFDTHVALVRSATHRPDDYARDVDQLAATLREANKSYADAGLSSDNLPSLADKVAGAVSDDASRDLPNERELRATFACNSVMQSALEKFRNTAKLWKASVEAGRIIRNFGSESDKLIERTLDAYDKDAIVHKSTNAFSRKRNELKAQLLSDSYALFAKQILKVRENAYQVFRSKLARIRINDQVEKNVRNAVKDAEMFFVQNGDSLRSKLGNWRFDNERHELVNHMRDDATERLQLARLQGNYVPNIRAPIAFAFHTLLLAPLGRDSRFVQPHAEEMKPTYDPDKVKQPGMMRTRPYQRGHPFRYKNRYDFDQESLDLLADFFGDRESDNDKRQK